MKKRLTISAGLPDLRYLKTQCGLHYARACADFVSLPPATFPVNYLIQ